MHNLEEKGDNKQIKRKERSQGRLRASVNLLISRRSLHVVWPSDFEWRCSRNLCTCLICGSLVPSNPISHVPSLPIKFQQTDRCISHAPPARVARKDLLFGHVSRSMTGLPCPCPVQIKRDGIPREVCDYIRPGKTLLFRAWQNFLICHASFGNFAVIRYTSAL